MTGEDGERVEASQPMQTAQPFFTSCMCATVLPIIHLLEDLEVNTDGISGKNTNLSFLTYNLEVDSPCNSIYKCSSCGLTNCV